MDYDRNEMIPPENRRSSLANMSPYRVALVTGGSGGIGREIVCSLAGAGLFVWVGYNNNKGSAERVAENAANCSGSDVKPIRIDASSVVGAEYAVSSAEEISGPIDILINSAGINVRQRFLEVTEEALREVFEINVFGLYFMCQAFAKRMVANGRNGRIINVSSIASKYALGDRSVYESSKASVDRITQSLAYELAPFAITVNAVAPGLVETAMTVREDSSDIAHRVRNIPMGRVGNAEEIASVVRYFAIEAPNYVTGTILPIDGGRLTV